MNDSKITCDSCGADLTTRWNSVDYRLLLRSEEKPIDPKINSVTDMMIYPPIDRDHHFCGKECLKKWINK